MSPQPQPFTLRVPDDAIADLHMRLERTRFPDQAPGEPWAYGTDVGYMRELVDYWRDRFDWQAQEALLNAIPQYKVPRCTGSMCISSMCRGRARAPARSCSRMAGRVRCSNSWS
jgi:hypothetical protein